MKAAGVAMPGVVAVTTKVPGSSLAVNAGVVAMPRAFVGTVARALNVPDGPDGGAVKVTDNPATGLP